MHSDTDGSPLLDVVAVVLTHIRPRLATATVRMLIEEEGLSRRQIVLVINGAGGLLDARLENEVDIVRLPSNLGPAGGFKAGLARFRDGHNSTWAYVCEDDIALLGLPTPRLPTLLQRANRLAAQGDVGAILAFARVLNRHTGRSVPYVPQEPAPSEGLGMSSADLGAWGATLVHRKAANALLPDANLFFGYEDFDYFLSLAAKGLALYVDDFAAMAMKEVVTDEGRANTFVGERLTDKEEAWRQYYLARNFILLARRHGRPSWVIDHLGRSLRRCQIFGFDRYVVHATVRGLLDGFRGRDGRNPAYLRSIGETTPQSVGDA